MNYVGKGKSDAESKPKGSEAVFSTVLKKKNKKNPEVQVAIARAYYDNGLKINTLFSLRSHARWLKKFPYVYCWKAIFLHAEGKSAAKLR
jgi:glucose-6-phosphate isomerase